MHFMPGWLLLSTGHIELWCEYVPFRILLSCGDAVCNSVSVSVWNIQQRNDWTKHLELLCLFTRDVLSGPRIECTERSMQWRVLLHTRGLHFIADNGCEWRTMRCRNILSFWIRCTTFLSEWSILWRDWSFGTIWELFCRILLPEWVEHVVADGRRSWQHMSFWVLLSCWVDWTGCMWGWYVSVDDRKCSAEQLRLLHARILLQR